MEITKTNYVDRAEDVIHEKIRRNPRSQKIELTTSKIRNILTITNALYEEAKRKNGPLLEDEISEIMYLKMRLVYESGRDGIVKDFVEKAKLIDYLKGIGDHRENLILYCRYVEALVAYHRYYGGKEN